LEACRLYRAEVSKVSVVTSFNLLECGVVKASKSAVDIT